MSKLTDRVANRFRRGWKTVTNRLSLWVNKGLQAFNLGQVFQETPAGEEEPRFMWKRGDTYEPCRDCELLDGQIKTASEWQRLAAVGIEPQSPSLECGGWNCQCKFVPV